MSEQATPFPENNEQNKTAAEDSPNLIADYYDDYKSMELDAAKGRVTKARNAIFAAGILIFIAEAITIARAGLSDGVYWVFPIGLLAIFLVLGFLCYKAPMATIISALVLFLLHWGLAIWVAGPEAIIGGIVIRGVIIYFLVTGINHAREAQRLRKELQQPMSKE